MLSTACGLLASKTITLLVIVFALSACEKPTTLEKIQKRQTLHVITRNAPAVYFEGRDGPMGFEYELAKLFADEHGEASML